MAAELERPAPGWLEGEVVLRRKTVMAYLAVLALCVGWLLSSQPEAPATAVPSAAPAYPSAPATPVEPVVHEPARQSYRGNL